MIDLVWHQVEPLIERVVEKAPDDIVSSIVHDELVLGNRMLVTISRGPDIIAVNVLDIKVLDSGVRCLYIPIIAGTEMELWLDRMHEVATTIAKEYNCTELRGLAVRKGWMSKLKPYGWEEMFTTVRCPIGE
jgi:hypothetical protein